MPGGGHRRFRDTGGTHPSHNLRVWNVETPLESGSNPVSRPQGRPNPSAGTGWLKKRMPVDRKIRGKPPEALHLQAITRRIQVTVT